MTLVKDLREGDLLDLRDDPYADPDGDELQFVHELAEVYGEPNFETPYCVIVYFVDLVPVGFPPLHLVNVVDHNDSVDKA